MNKHSENVLKAIETLQKQGKTISNKNVHAITGGSIALVGECVKSWKEAQKIQNPVADEIPEALKTFTNTINSFIIKFANDTAHEKTELFQNEIKELQTESLELIDNIKQVENEKITIEQKLVTANSVIIELQKQIAVEAAKNELVINQHLTEIERLNNDLSELKSENKEYKKLLINR